MLDLLDFVLDFMLNFGTICLGLSWTALVSSSLGFSINLSVELSVSFIQSFATPRSLPHTQGFPGPK